MGFVPPPPPPPPAPDASWIGSICVGCGAPENGDARCRYCGRPLRPGAGSRLPRPEQGRPTRRERLRYEREVGQTVERSAVRDAVAGGMARLFGALERELLGELPPALVGLREVETRDRLGAALESAKGRFREEMERVAQAEVLDNEEDEKKVQKSENKS